MESEGCSSTINLAGVRLRWTGLVPKLEDRSVVKSLVIIPIRKILPLRSRHRLKEKS